jgi:hypothetical protein
LAPFGRTFSKMITACSRNDGANPILSIGVGFVEFLIGELSAMRETSAFEDGPDNGMLLALEKLFVPNWCFVPEESRTVFVTMTFTVCALSRSPGTERIQKDFAEGQRDADPFDSAAPNRPRELRPPSRRVGWRRRAISESCWAARLATSVGRDVQTGADDGGKIVPGVVRID